MFPMDGHNVVGRTVRCNEDFVDRFIERPFLQAGLHPILPSATTSRVIVGLMFNDVGILFVGISGPEVVREGSDGLSGLDSPLRGMRGHNVGLVSGVVNHGGP